MLKIRTVCENEIWSGFFGINPNGDQPECSTTVEIDVEAGCYEMEEDGTIRPSFSVECPKCHCSLEWPQEWEKIVDGGDE